MTTLLDRQKEFTGYLVAGFPDLSLGGLPLKAACAVTGNATQENRVLPITVGPKDHGSDGVLQWRLDRLTGPHGLVSWAQAQGLAWDTLRTQAAFFLWELHQYYPALERDLREATKKIETLTANICKYYERPNMSLANLDGRIAAAKSTYAAMTSTQAPSALAKTVAGATVATVTATVANAVGGGDTILTHFGLTAAMVGVVLTPILDKWAKARQPVAPPPASAPVPTTTTLTTPTGGLQAALDRLRECRVALEQAIAQVASERQKVAERLTAIHATLAAADKEAAGLSILTQEAVGAAQAAPAAPAQQGNAHPMETLAAVVAPKDNPA